MNALHSAGEWLHRLTGGRFATGPETLVLERVTVVLPDLAPHLDGLKIGLLSDLHLGAWVPPAVVERAAAILRAEEPDLIAVAGDFTDHSDAVPDLHSALAPLAGAYGVRGNWDTLDTKVYRQRAVRILMNEGLLVRPGLWLAGIDDQVGGFPDLRRALDDAPLGAVRVLIAHEPDIAAKLTRKHNVALVLSGHTHGGQVRLPVIGPAILPPGGRKYVAGLYQAPACQVYVSRGVGTIHLPIRIACPPEVTLLTLRTPPPPVTA